MFVKINLGLCAPLVFAAAVFNQACSDIGAEAFSGRRYSASSDASAAAGLELKIRSFGVDPAEDVNAEFHCEGKVYPLKLGSNQAASTGSCELHFQTVTIPGLGKIAFEDSKQVLPQSTTVDGQKLALSLEKDSVNGQKRTLEVNLVYGALTLVDLGIEIFSLEGEWQTVQKADDEGLSLAIFKKGEEELALYNAREQAAQRSKDDIFLSAGNKLEDEAEATSQSGDSYVLLTLKSTTGQIIYGFYRKADGGTSFGYLKGKGASLKTLEEVLSSASKV